MNKELPAGLVGAVIAVTAWSTGTVIAKHIDMGGLAIAVYRFWFFSLLMVGWMAAKGTPFRFVVLRHSFFGGVALGLDIAFFFSAVKLTNVVNATLIGSLQPIVVGIIAARFFGETIAKRDALWSGVALVGVAGVILASNGTPEWSPEGDVLALAAMFTWSAYFIFSKRSRGVLSSTEYTAGTAIWTALINTPLAFVFGQSLSWPSSNSLFWLLVMTLTSGLIGHSLMNWSLVRIPLWVGSTMTLFIPVASSILAWLFLSESLSVFQAAAMAVVLGALVAIVRGQTTGADEVDAPTAPIEPNTSAV